MWHRLQHWISCERLLFVIQVIIVVSITIIINLLHVDVIWLRGGWILIDDLLHGAVVSSPSSRAGDSFKGDARLFASGFGEGAAVLDCPKITLRNGMSSR